MHICGSSTTGWNVVEALDGPEANAVVKKCTWGLALHGLSGNGGAPVFNRRSGVAPGVSPVSGIRGAGPATAEFHGAGGIGGLLAAEETAATGSPAYWFPYDNGNVGYGPTHPFRFSKCVCNELKRNAVLRASCRQCTSPGGWSGFNGLDNYQKLSRL